MPVTGLPVICLHGLTRHSRDFGIVARGSRARRRVLALTYVPRAIGARSQSRHYSPSSIRGVLNVLIAWRPARRVPGTSMGGSSRWSSAATAPARIAPRSSMMSAPS